MKTPWSQTQLFSSADEKWATPRPLYYRIVRTLGIEVHHDIAAQARTAVVPSYFGPDHVDPARRDAFRFDLPPAGGLAGLWCNPPYSREVGRWVELCYHLARRGWPVAVLVLARTDTTWWHDVVLRHAREVLFVRGRVRFVDPETMRRAQGAPAPSVAFSFWPGERVADVPWFRALRQPR